MNEMLIAGTATNGKIVLYRPAQRRKPREGDIVANPENWRFWRIIPNHNGQRLIGWECTDEVLAQIKREQLQDELDRLELDIIGTHDAVVAATR